MLHRDLSKKKQIWSLLDTCNMCRRAAHNLLVLAPGYHPPYVRRPSRTMKETKAKKSLPGVVGDEPLETRETKNTVKMAAQRRRENVSKYFWTNEADSTSFDSSFAYYNSNFISLINAGENERGRSFGNYELVEDRVLVACVAKFALILR